jgi:GNAT superfamily N-acetyltransferase
MTTSTQNHAVRPAQLRDSAAIVALINEAYLVESFFVEGPRTTEESIQALIEKGEILALKSEENRIAATAHLRCHGSSGHLGLISVCPALQGQGLGRRIIDAAEARARSQGCTAMHIQVVNLRSELRDFYRRLGFRQTGTSEFPDVSRTLQAVHFLEMQKPLG